MGDGGELAKAFVGEGVGIRTGNGLDSTSARCDRGFASYLDESDFSCGLYVRATAQFLAPSAKIHYSNDVTVLVTEEGHYVVGLFRVGNFNGFDGVVGEEVFVGESFDFLDLRRGDSFEMGKVETQAIGLYERTRLTHVIAQYLAQCPVQDVGGGVVSLDGEAPA